MKKSFIVTLAVGLGLAGGAGKSATTVQAASWHKGNPSWLVGKKYHTKLQPKSEQAGPNRRETIIGTKSKLKVIGYQYGANLKNMVYKKVGKYYYIKEKSGNYSYQVIKVRRYSSKKIHIKLFGMNEYMYRY